VANWHGILAASVAVIHLVLAFGYNGLSSGPEQTLCARQTVPAGHASNRNGTLMGIKIGVVMDPVGSISFRKDSTLAMLLAAQRRNWDLYYMEQANLFLEDSHCHAHMARLKVRDDPQDWYTLQETQTAPLGDLDVLLMRKDPPFDMEYLYTTYLLERAETDGVLVVNRPGAIRDANEKLYTAWFAQCCVPMRVSRDTRRLKDFLDTHGDIIVKPLNGMGGSSVFRVRAGDPNMQVILETITDNGRRSVMAQRYIPEITAGDKRILLINGEPFPHALARIPAVGENRGNLAAGATGMGVDLNDRDLWICEQVGPALRERGLLFVGLDVIGDYLTEINVTSPTCIRELDAQYGSDIAGQLMDAIAHKLGRTT